MKKTTVDVTNIINTMDQAIADLKEGIPAAKLSKKAKKEVREELEEAIALAKKLKKKVDKV